jgi:hypothetical protein
MRITDTPYAPARNGTTPVVPCPVVAFIGPAPAGGCPR